jgi:uncharacterized damage-inducible protein DinB
MENLNFIRQLFEYDYWANREALASVATVAGDAERTRKYFSHVFGAQWIWLARFDDPSSPSAQAWPMLSDEECRQAIEDLHRQWTALLDRLNPDKLEEDLAYRNLKGIEFKTPIRDVLMHLVTHSAYHRGQVAAAVREAGGKPAATDYAVYVRKMKA